MAPEPLKRLLDEVDPGRRDFFKMVVAASAFAVPLVQSFSMDGLAPAAEGAAVANMSCLVSNQTGQPYSGPARFKAILRDSSGKIRGRARFDLLGDCADIADIRLQYSLTISGRIETGRDDFTTRVWLPDAELRTPYLFSFPIRLHLTAGTGVLTMAALSAQHRQVFAGALEDLEAGLGEVRVETVKYGLVTGPVVAF